MKNTKLDHQREDSRHAHSGNDGRGPTKTIVHFFSRTPAILMLAAVAYALPAQSQQNIVAFDPPGSVSTFVQGISTSGLITGSYTDTNNVGHGFLRTPNGQCYTDANNDTHGFVLDQNGYFTTIDPPGSNATLGSGIAPNGTIAGNYYDANYNSHGFLRTRNGHFTTFDPQGSVATYVTGINPDGVITGYYDDANYNSHGYVFQSQAEYLHMPEHSRHH